VQVREISDAKVQVREISDAKVQVREISDTKVQDKEISDTSGVGDFPVLHFLPVFDFISHFYQLFLVYCLTAMYF
jgi:hypothetical protein